MRRFLAAILVVAMLTASTFAQPADEERPGILQSLFGTPLQRALSRGMKPGNDLADELAGLDDYVVSTRRDAEAIVAALAKLTGDEPRDDDVFTSPVYVLAALFHEVDGRDGVAYEVLREQGVPHLIRLFDKLSKSEHALDRRDALILLQIFAVYHSREGAERLVAAARQPLSPDEYQWFNVLAIYSSQHPHRDYVYQSLSDPLPPDFIGISLLDSANSAALDNLAKHPFDTPAGKKRLQELLINPDSDEFSYAYSATSALPYISNPERDQLLTMALQHAAVEIQLQAAKVATQLGRQDGLALLVRYCRDVNYSLQAQEALLELKKDELIPEEADEPTFQARAMFANWLAHPNELGQPPDEVEVVDHRELAWPPDRQRQPFWIIKYRLRDTSGLEEDDVDCGLVGSLTWCFFSREMHRRPAEDIYALHCAWEMQVADPPLIEEIDVENPDDYASLLEQWTGPKPEEARVMGVAKLAARLRYPARRVAVAIAMVDGQPGYLVLDGPRSRFYPHADFPSPQLPYTILDLHIGRQLLGFKEEPDRKKVLAQTETPPQRTPQQIVAAYEKLLDELDNASAERRIDLLDWKSPFRKNFDKYVDAAAQVRETPRNEAFIKAYERFLRVSQTTESEKRAEVIDEAFVLRDFFADYVDALIASGRSSEVASLVSHFEPFWDDDSGYSLLGTATYKIGDIERAEVFLKKLYEESHMRFQGEEFEIVSWYFGDEMRYLAEIWHRQGKHDDARALLMKGIGDWKEAVEEATDEEERAESRRSWEAYRETFLRLYPDHAAELGT